MEVLTLALIILSIYLYNTKNTLKKNSQFFETNYRDYYKKYNQLLAEIENTQVEFEIKKPSKRRSGYSNGITPEDITYYQEKKLEKIYLIPQKNLEDKSHHFYGKKVVITGDFENYPDRNEIARLLWEVGADVDTGIGKYTQTVIFGSNPGPSKMITAEDMGCEMICENDFLNLFKA